ncbi:hypothetical protein Tco_0572678 [Tanacetum coccineum]
MVVVPIGEWLKFNNRDFTLDTRKEFKKRLTKIQIKEIECPEGLNFEEFAWNRLFRIKEQVVREYVMEFLSSFTFRDHIEGLDEADTMVFQHGGEKRSMTDCGCRKDFYKKFYNSLGTMAGVDVNTLTMEQYLALSRENQAPGVVKPEIRGNVNFKIKSQFMRELREDTFSGNKDEDAHGHIDRVLSIVGLFNIPGVSKDAVMLRVFPFTLTGAAKRWVDRLAPGIINTYDLFKKAFIQRYYPPSMIVKKLEDIHNFKQEGNESLYQVWERYNDLLYKCPTHDINSHQKGPIPGMRPAKALTAIQTMADHSQKWQDGTTSRNIRSGSSKDGLAALVNKLDNLGRDMKNLKESVHAIQVNWRFDLEELLSKHQEESARRSTEMEVWIKKLQENTKINTRNQDASLKNLETHIEQITRELCSRKEKSKQAKVFTIKNEGPSSPKKLKNLHGISFLSDSQEENTNDPLPTKEANLGHFMLPCTISNFNFYAMADLGASVNVLPRNIFEYLELTNLSEIEMLVEIADLRKKAPLGIVRDILVEDSVWSKRYSEWCNEKFHNKEPRPRDYTFKEWVKLKKGHLDISKSVRKDLFKLWVIDKSTEALDPDKDPFGRCLDEYNWVFPK